MIGSVTLALIAGGFVAFLGYKKFAGKQQQGPLRVILKARLGLAQGRQREFRRHPGRRGDFAEARQSASGRCPHHGRQQRSDPQRHAGRAGISGPHRDCRDLADGRLARSVRRAAGRGRHSRPDRRSRGAAGYAGKDPGSAAQRRQGHRRQQGRVEGHAAEFRDLHGVAGEQHRQARQRCRQRRTPASMLWTAA